MNTSKSIGAGAEHIVTPARLATLRSPRPVSAEGVGPGEPHDQTIAAKVLHAEAELMEALGFAALAKAHRAGGHDAARALRMVCLSTLTGSMAAHVDRFAALLVASGRLPDAILIDRAAAQAEARARVEAFRAKHPNLA